MMRALITLALFVTSCSHDASRENPLDPSLTPPVELTATVNDSTGATTLAWTPADSQADFSSYWILRKVSELEAVDTLAVVEDRRRTSYVDTSVVQGISYFYRVSVVNAAGLETTSLVHEAESLRLPPLRITSADFDSPSATATLAWTPYSGPRFRAYEIVRDTDGAAETIAQLNDVSQTSYVDSFLRGNAAYEYRLRIRTTRGEVGDSQPVAGSIHALVAQWPHDAEIDPLGERNARLYAEGDGVTALVADRGSVRLLTYSATGELLQEQTLLDLVSGIHSGRAIAAAVAADGERLLSFIGQTGSLQTFVPASYGVLRFDASGALQYDETSLFEAELQAIEAQAADLPGGILVGTQTLSAAYFDNVVVSEDGVSVLEEEFLTFPDETSVASNAELVPLNEWTLRFGPARVTGAGRRLRFQPGALVLADQPWRQFEASAEVSPLSGASGLAIGSYDDGPHLALVLDSDRHQLELRWYSSGPTPPAPVIDVLGEWQEVEQVTTAPFPVLIGAPYGLGLGWSADGLRAWIRSAALWSGTSEADVVWGSLAVIDGRTALVADDEVRAIDDDGTASTLTSLRDWASEVRVWEDAAGNGQAIGVCLPEANMVQMTAPLRGRSQRWSDFLRRDLGPFLGERGGSLSYPISFDVGPDGRTYVLDAGNGRVVVFDGQDRYLTEWGTRGDGAGELDLGTGAVRRDRGFDLAGSIAVDEDGFIYVADVGNRRIQRFAP